MIFLAIMPLSAMFFNFMIPLQIGARDVAFPRLNAFSYWVFLLGGLFLNVELPVRRGAGPGLVRLRQPDLAAVSRPGPTWTSGYMGLQILGVASLAAAVNFFVTIVNMRAPRHDDDADADVRLDELHHPDPASCWPSRSSPSR